MSADVRFFRNYNRVIGLAYGGLLLAVGLFFTYQLVRSFKDEVVFIEGQVERHAQFLEFVLRTSTDQIEELRMSAGRPDAARGAAARRCAVAAGPNAFGDLSEHGGGFDRDGAVDRDAGGNLIGQGSLRGRPPVFYCDLQAALGLNGHLRAMAFHLPHVARARFVSAQDFQVVAPWRPSQEAPFGRAVYAEAVWQLAQPAANPDRLKFWAPPYFAGEDTGLLAPLAAPVYDGNRFMGVVSLDMSLDYLNRVNSGFAYPLGSVAVVNTEGWVLAHPGIFADPLKVKAPGEFTQALPSSLLPVATGAVATHNGQAFSRDGWTVIRRGFVSAPWQLVYAVPTFDLWSKLLYERGASMLAVLVGLALLMALTYAVTSREFVGPAAKLVSHLVAESSFRPQPLPLVPSAWKPWFEAITRAFRESLQLSSLRRELDIAARMQQSILPRTWPADPRFMLWGTTVPAREVGGDFYDHFLLADGQCAMVVADVSGKGIAAGLFAMVSKTLLRSVATQRQLPPSGVAAHVNDGLCRDNDNAMFVTTLYAQYDAATGALRYANAGHPPPLIVRADGSCQWLAPTRGTAFGVMEELVYQEAAARLEPGDLLLMYSDGVTEAQDTQGREFGAERLKALFEGRAVDTPHEAIRRVTEAVDDFAGEVEQFDDITCMALRCAALGERAAAGAPGPAKEAGGA
ncbi:MAG TPA: SpoIIE family protein phosphatase [Ramlibacter sp.]|nr:SpoIIE family protein phosphatase [Ramlibacter sp.]